MTCRKPWIGSVGLPKSTVWNSCQSAGKSLSLSIAFGLHTMWPWKSLGLFDLSTLHLTAFATRNSLARAMTTLAYAINLMLAELTKSLRCICFVWVPVGHG